MPKISAKKAEKELPAFLTTPNKEIFLTGNFVVLDFETTNIDYGDPVNEENSVILAVAYSSWNNRTNVFIGSEYDMGGLVDLVEKADFIVAQNAKFELGWLRRCGLDLTKVLAYCTMVGRYVEAGNLFCKKDLNSLATHYKIGKFKDDTVSTLIKAGISPEDIPLSWLKKYCNLDVELTKQVFLRQREVLSTLNLLGVMYLRSLYLPALTDIEFNGMCLDKERIDIIYNKYKAQYDKYERKLFELTGGINQNSPKQVAEYIYGELGFRELTDSRGNPFRTEAGKPRTDQATLGALKASTSRQRRFLEVYLKVAKLESKLSKYLKKMKDCCDENNGILHASFNVAVTKTHRLSSSGKKYKIQYQNLDRELKPVFRARYDGWEVGEADEAQLEFRAAVHLGDDEQGRMDIANGVDVHARTSSILTEEGQPTNRQDAKSHTFKPLYGGSSGTPAEQAYYAAFKERYHGVAEWQQTNIDKVLETKVLEMETGFKFYFPKAEMSRSGYVNDTTNICNYPVQHFATAEIVPIGFVYLWHRMKSNQMESFLVNTVHDSAIGEIHPQEKELYQKLAVQAFTEDVYDYLKKAYNITLSVPLDAEVVISPHWAEKKGWTEKYLGEINEIA